MDKIYKKYQGHTIENGFSETSPDFKKFASYVKKRMKIAATDRGIVLEDFIVGHYFISGFFRKNEKWAYFSFDECRNSPLDFTAKDCWKGFLIQMKRDVILKPNRMFYPEKNYSHQELVLHATLLSRIFFNNNYSRKRSKQKDLKLFNLASNEELKEYIIHFFEDSFDPEEKGHKDAEDWESIPGTRYDIPDTRHEYTSCTAGDYGPGNPWDAPGMSIRDFI